MSEFKNKFKVGDTVKIIRTGKIGEIKYVYNHDFLSQGNSVSCYCVEFTNSDFAWYTVHDLKLAKQILDNTEKEYLSNVIKPFKKDVVSIGKIKHIAVDEYYLEIILKRADIMCFPTFKNSNMYKKMKLNKKYTLKELRIIGGSHE